MAKPYKDETGKSASSKINSKTGISDWQKRFIEDKANKLFKNNGGAGGDKGGAFITEQTKRAIAENKKTMAAKKPVVKKVVAKKPVAKKPTMPPKRPMVGDDKAFNKKYGSKSWNNGYTN